MEPARQNQGFTDVEDLSKVGDTKWYLTAPYHHTIQSFHEKIRPIPNGQADTARFIKSMTN